MVAVVALEEHRAAATDADKRPISKLHRAVDTLIQHRESYLVLVM
jgi:hypothetical protein